MSSLVRAALLSLSLTPAVLFGQSQLTLTPLFGDHAVVQRGMPIRIPGKAVPGAKVTATLLKSETQSLASTETTAGPDGRFRLELPAMQAGDGPFTIHVDAGGEGARTAKDIWVGEVWLASGQSNMEWTVAQSANPDAEKKALADPMVRVIKAPHVTAAERSDLWSGEWKIATEQNTPNFTAVGASFARELRAALKMPIGILDVNWGGTRAEPWTDPAALAANPVFAERMAAFDKEMADVRKLGPNGPAKRYQKALWDFTADAEKWWIRACKGDEGMANWVHFPETDISAWPEADFPCDYKDLDASLADFDGVVWIRRTVDIPKEMQGLDMYFDFGPIDDCDRTYVNGRPIGQTVSGAGQNRNYLLPAEMTRTGKMTIAIQMVDVAGAGGGRNPDAWKIRGGPDGKLSVPLPGKWRWKKGHVFTEVPPKAPNKDLGPGTRSHDPGAMFHGMIMPIAGWPIRGAVWYQGESNAGNEKDATDYASLLPTMVKSWRDAWGCGDFAFGVVSLAGFRPFNADKACDGIWPILRRSQFTAAASMPKAGIIQTYDVGAANDIHPKDKQTVGKRLAAWALASVYAKQDEKPVAWLGPRPLVAERRGDTVALKIESDGPLKAVRRPQATEGMPTGFAAGSGTFARVTAEISGDEIILKGDALKDATEIRYAWQDNPEDANVTDAKGLPMVPFGIPIR